jgi:hypothetical protein
MTSSLLEAEVLLIERFLAGFHTSRPPKVGLGSARGTLWIRKFPLPDGMRPDHLDLVLDMSCHPQEPPKGIYLLSGPNNQALLDQLKRHFNVFHNNAAHGAKAVEGFEWVCFGFFEKNWRYNVAAPHKGDNTAKMLQEFWRALVELRS